MPAALPRAARRDRSEQRGRQLDAPACATRTVYHTLSAREGCQARRIELRLNDSCPTCLPSSAPALCVHASWPPPFRTRAPK
eukprot:1196834-Alexandrium_andersonii.AAC.1